MSAGNRAIDQIMKTLEREGSVLVFFEKKPSRPEPVPERILRREVILPPDPQWLVRAVKALVVLVGLAISPTALQRPENLLVVLPLAVGSAAVVHALDRLSWKRRFPPNRRLLP